MVYYYLRFYNLDSPLLFLSPPSIKLVYSLTTRHRAQIWQEHETCHRWSDDRSMLFRSQFVRELLVGVWGGLVDCSFCFPLSLLWSHYTNTWEKKGVRLLKRRFLAAMQDGSLEVGAVQNRGTWEYLKFPYFAEGMSTVAAISRWE